jgi:hypothetical protein
MKNIIMGLLLFATFTTVKVNAAEFLIAGGVSYSISRASVCGQFGDDCHKEAVQLLQDAQDYTQLGTMSALLSQKVKDIQESAPDVSDEEAIDLLVEASSTL